MPRLKAAVQIDAPREHVFALVADPSKLAEWTTFVKEAVVTSGDAKSAGTTDRMVSKIGPMRNNFEGRWTEFRPGEVFAREFGGYFTGSERITLTPSDSGTSVEWSVNYTPPYGLLGKFGAWFMMARIYQNELEASLENLKKALET